MKIDYTNLSFTQLIDKIEANRFFDLPRMVREAFRRLTTRVETLETSTEPKYKVYTALLTQSGTDAPVATVLENTLGGTVVWSRTNPGEYVATLVGAFTENKTFLNNPIINNIEGRLNQLNLQILDTNSIRIIGGEDLVSLEPVTDGYLSGDQIEIRVYN